MNDQLYKDVMGDASKRSAFNQLAQQTLLLHYRLYMKYKGGVG